jgi:hypothetical protein
MVHFMCPTCSGFTGPLGGLLGGGEPTRGSNSLAGLFGDIGASGGNLLGGLLGGLFGGGSGSSGNDPLGLLLGGGGKKGKNSG